jgi:spermidine/putrescine transport system permease protein
MERASSGSQRVPSARAARPRQSWATWVLGLNAAWSYFFLYAPILILILFSFNQSRFGAKWTGWTLDWYRQMFRDDRIADAFQTTMLIAVTSTVIATTIGTMLALALERYRFRGRTTLDATLYLPIIIPDIVMAVALLAFFSFVFRLLNGTLGLSLRNGLATVIIAHVAFNISFVTVVVRASLRNFDRRLEEAAQDLGANPWQTFRYVTLPLIMPGIGGGALIAFTLSLDDFVVTFFTSGPGVNTLPLEVYSRVRKTITPEINAVSTLMLLGSVALVAASLLLQRKQGRYRTRTKNED